MGVTLFFYEILRLFLEGYLQFVVSSWLGFFALDKTAAGSIFGYIFSALILIMCWGVLPFLSVYMLLPRNRNRLKDLGFRKRIGAFY